MSEDVTPAAFERQRSALLSLLEDVAIAESNCPTGARVAVVGYSAYTKYLIRFQDYHRKTQLIDSVRNIALERTSNRRQLGAAMRFVGQNVFKRVRAGVMMRKVAVFLSNGPTQDVNEVVTAMMEYRGLNIVPAVISLRNAPAVGRAMEVGLICQQLINWKPFSLCSVSSGESRCSMSRDSSGGCPACRPVRTSGLAPHAAERFYISSGKRCRTSGLPSSAAAVTGSDTRQKMDGWSLRA